MHLPALSLKTSLPDILSPWTCKITIVQNVTKSPPARVILTFQLPVVHQNSISPNNISMFSSRRQQKEHIKGLLSIVELVDTLFRL